MSTGQMNEKRAAGWAAIVITVILAGALLAGCGGQDEAETSVPETSQAMVPGAGESTNTDPAAAAGAVEAEAMAAPGSDRGLDAQVLERATVQESQPAASSPAAAAMDKSTVAPQVVANDGTYSLQLGSFRSAENARAQSARIAALGYTPTLEVASLGGQTYHRIVLRGLADRNEAERLGENIRSQLGITYLIRQK